MQHGAKGKYTSIDLNEQSSAFWPLLWLNAAALAVHLAFAVAFFSAESKPSHEVQLVRVVSNWTSRGLDGFVLSIEDDMTLSYKTLGGFSFAAAVVAHLVAVYALAAWLSWQTPGSFAHWYVRSLASGWHVFRWVEYGVSASAQAVTIALGVGIREKNLLLLIFLSHTVVMYFGYLAELFARPVTVDPPESRQKTNDGCCTRCCGWLPTWLSDLAKHDENVNWSHDTLIRLMPFFGGVLAITGPWVVIFISFANSVDDTRRMRSHGAPDMPWWVPLALFGTFITFISFAFNALVFLVIRPTLHRFVFCEGIYVMLSLTSKVWLGALVYVNLIL